MPREDHTTLFIPSADQLDCAMIAVSAMLNRHQGGRICLGPWEGRSLEQNAVTDQMMQAVKAMFSEVIRPVLLPKIAREQTAGSELIRLEFSGEEFPYSAFGRYYISAADGDRELSPAELRRLVTEHEYAEHWENRATQQHPGDVDTNTLEFFLQAASCGRFLPISCGKEEILTQLGVLKGSCLTNAGVCLFSRHKPLCLRMGVFATEHREKLLETRLAEGNIFELIDEATAFLLRSIRWHEGTPGGINGKRKVPEIPVQALREAVINSFAHARYDMPVQHEIAVFSDRIAVCNPGSFASECPPWDPVPRNVHSRPRNRVICQCLRLGNFMSVSGTGIRNIHELCNTAGVRLSSTNEEQAFTMEFARISRDTKF